MFIPTSIDEHLMFSTVLIKTLMGSGTAFILNLKNNGETIPILITNKHVIGENQSEEVSFEFHLRDGENNLSSNKIEISLSINWVFLTEFDICFCFLGPIVETIKKEAHRDIFQNGIKQSYIWSKDKLQKELSMIEDVIMIGHPIGLSDRFNSLPIFRTGITASHPGIDFNNKGIGIVDIAAFPGSSGSPIFILNKGQYTDKKNNTYFGATRVVFLGVLFSGPVHTLEGNIEKKLIPMNFNSIVKTQIMTNLGYYIMSSDMVEEILKRVREIIKSNQAEQNNWKTGKMKWRII